MSQKPVAGGHRLRRRYQQTLPEMEVRQGVGTRQSELFGDSAASGSDGSARDVHYGLSFGASEVVLVLQRKPLAGNDGRGKVWIGSACSPSAGDATFPTGVTAAAPAAPATETAAVRFPPCSAHHQANGHHNYHKPIPRSDSLGNQMRAVGPPPQQQQQLQDQPLLAKLQGFDLG